MLREAVSKPPCPRCGRPGHWVVDDAVPPRCHLAPHTHAATPAGGGAHGQHAVATPASEAGWLATPAASPPPPPHGPSMQALSVAVLREYLGGEFAVCAHCGTSHCRCASAVREVALQPLRADGVLPFGWDLERLVDDVVFMVRVAFLSGRRVCVCATTARVICGASALLSPRCSALVCGSLVVAMLGRSTVCGVGVPLSKRACATHGLLCVQVNFVGNDFLPQLPGVDVHEAALDRVIAVYVEVGGGARWRVWVPCGGSLAGRGVSAVLYERSCLFDAHGSCMFAVVIAASRDLAWRVGACVFHAGLRRSSRPSVRT